jgi:enoyl-CoA hydratase
VIRYERRGPAALVTINRPERHNAIDGATAQALLQAFTSFKDDDADVLVLTGAGGRAFCAGADLKALETLDVDAPGGPLGFTRLASPKPTIAAISGHCLAGGLELALWCDLRVADETAVFGVFCRRFGVPLIDGGTVRLPRAIGMSRALDMILTGRAVDAIEAQQFGLLNRLVKASELVEKTRELALQIAAFPQTCMRNDRRSAYEQWTLAEAEAIRNEFRHGAKTLESGETVAGATRFTRGAGKHGKFDA